MIINCSYSNPLYFDPLELQLKPLDSDVLKTTTWNYSSSTCEIVNATSSIPNVQNGFTNGEIITSFFLFFISMLILVAIINNFMSDKKTKNYDKL